MLLFITFMGKKKYLPLQMVYDAPKSYILFFPATSKHNFAPMTRISTFGVTRKQFFKKSNYFCPQDGTQYSVFFNSSPFVF